MGSESVAIGALSDEIVSAVFAYSARGVPLALISSQNQIDASPGYTGWTTQSYMTRIRELRKQYPTAQVSICRDHCGPGFGPKPGLGPVYETIRADLEAGFDQIHIDYSRCPGPRAEQAQRAQHAIELCREYKPDVLIEVATEDNDQEGAVDLFRLTEEARFFLQGGPIEYFVLRTGTRVMEGRQVGAMRDCRKYEALALASAVNDITCAARRLHDLGLRIKEHNGDWASREDLEARRGLIDCVNVAPEFGVLQTDWVLARCTEHGIDTRAFREHVYQAGMWRKWDAGTLAGDPDRCLRTAGHYHYTNEHWRRLLDQLGDYRNIRQQLIEAHQALIHHYVEGLA